MADTRYELRITIRDGRYFPQPKGKGGLAISVAFDDAVKRTRSLFDIDHPDWREDLVFEFTAADLKTLKKKRAPIKVEAFSPESKSNSMSGIMSSKEKKGQSFGYVMLDLRTAELNLSMKNATPMKPGAPTSRSGGKWFQLLRSGERQPPELRLYPVLGPVTEPLIPSPAKKSPVQKSSPTKQEQEEIEDFLPEEEEEQEQPEKQQEIEHDIAESPVYQRAIRGARVLPDSVQERLLHVGKGLICYVMQINFHGGFKLSHLVFGVSQPTPEALLEYSQYECHWEIELLGARSKSASFHLGGSHHPDIGTGESDFCNSVLSAGRDSLVFTSTCESNIVILSSESELFDLLTGNASPAMAISLVREKRETCQVLATALVNLNGLTLRTPLRFRSEFESSSRVSEQPAPSVDGEISLVCQTQESKAETVEEARQQAASIPEIVPAVAPSKIELPEEPVHSWRVAIDLRSIRDLSLTTEFPDTLSVFMKYAYPLFGSPLPITTDPPVSIEWERDEETLVPGSFCLFEFAAKLSELMEGLQENPLNVGMYYRNADKGDVCFADLQCPVHLALEAPDIIETAVPKKNDPKSKKKGQKPTPKSLQTHDAYIPLYLRSEGEEKPVCGYVRCIINVEDMGKLRLPPSRVELEQHRRRLEDYKESQKHEMDQHPGIGPSEYSAAWEYEMWRKTEELRFKEELEEKANEYLNEIALEWKRKEYERQQEFGKRLESATKMEEELKKRDEELRHKERQVKDAQAAVTRLKTNISTEHEQIVKSAQDSVRRQKEEAQHQVDILKGRLNESERNKRNAKGHAEQLEKRYADLEEAFAVYRRKHFNDTGTTGKGGKHETKEKAAPKAPSKSEEFQNLQAKYNRLQETNTELRVKMSAAETQLKHVTEAKDRCMVELEKAVGTVRAMKKDREELEAARLREEKELIELERARIAAAEESAKLVEEQERLKEIKGALSRLKMEEARITANVAVHHTGDGDITYHYAAGKDASESNTEEAASRRKLDSEMPLTKPEVHNRVVHRDENSWPLPDAETATAEELKKQRSLLLGTAVYTVNDPIIKRLDSLIDMRSR